MKKTLLAMAVLGTLCACTTASQQILTGYEASAQKSIEATNDNAIRVWSSLACGTPFSAAIRNPQIIPALKALCLPGGDQSNPASLLVVPAK
ncbi:MAG: hypothetical protein V4447_10575 [Pseudomonadota bacterium]